MMTDMERLIEAVEAGTWLPNGVALYPMDFPDTIDEADGKKMTRAYLGSLDAAHALHEALLPGWQYELDNIQTTPWAMVEDGFGNGGFQGYGETLARAWLLAILRAKAAQE